MNSSLNIAKNGKIIHTLKTQYTDPNLWNLSFSPTERILILLEKLKVKELEPPSASHYVVPVDGYYSVSARLPLHSTSVVIIASAGDVIESNGRVLAHRI